MRLALCSRVTAVFLPLLGLEAAVHAAAAAPPEYMVIEPRVGQGYEIAGALDNQGFFVATDIEEATERGHPRLRGALAEVDAKTGTVILHGTSIAVVRNTLFDGQLNPAGAGALATGQRVEINCDIDSATGRWRARKIVTTGVKASNKIKGTVTKASVDGAAPDTLEISGFRILLTVLTDVKLPLDLAPGRIEQSLFGDLAWANASQLRRGRPLAGGRLLLGGHVATNVRSKSEFDLTTSFHNNEDDTEPQARLELSGYAGTSWRGRVQARARRRMVLSSDTRRPSDDVHVEVTQLYALWKDIGGRRVAFAVGRQDVDEPREWLFDEYLDAVRVFAWGRNRFAAEAALFHPVIPLKDKYETWTDYLAMGHCYLARKSIVSAYVLARSDRHTRNRQPVWTGLRWSGLLREQLRPWMDIASMRGEDSGQPLRAWAVDLGTTVQATARWAAPSLTVGWAWGSGDADGGDGVDRTFRQTGYQDNYARFAGVTRFHYYGTLLDPELSNLSIWTFGVGAIPSYDSSVDLVGHLYRQDSPDDRLRSSELVNPPARPNGVSSDLGWAADLIVAAPRVRDILRVTWTVGVFGPGSAFEPRRGTAILFRADVSATF